MKELYRFQLDYDLEPIGDDPEGCRFIAVMGEMRVPVISETKATFTIKDNKGKVRRIMKGAINTYAHEKREDALKNFYHRTRSYENILRSKCCVINELLEKVKKEHGHIIFGKK